MTAGDGINNLLNPRLRSLREKYLAFGSRTHIFWRAVAHRFDYGISGVS